VPIAKFTLVALDCPDPRALAEFYAAIVGGSIRNDETAEDWVRLETGTGCDIGFQLAPDHQPPAHLDLDVTDLPAAEKAVLALGAVRAEVQPSPQEWLVFLDPAGHPFCLIQR
jgi:predicted enzyme related to lactoylglutathione lyase